MCGEQIPNLAKAEEYSGSSPRVRGTAAPSRPYGGVLRFIPACAGNSRLQRAQATTGSVHPRVCGEQSLLVTFIPQTGGSSPRVRGTVEFSESVWSGARFIPACAGNSLEAAAIVDARAVHPRVCGEQPYFCTAFQCVVGSSPRVRGTAVISALIEGHQRFIPACAGNRRVLPAPVVSLTVHPRVCGEQALYTGIGPLIHGSSPRVRGTDRERRRGIHDHRFIPACAGNSALRRGRGLLSPVHPRVCGEQPNLTPKRPPDDGSSPRVRGTDLTPIRAFCTVRFIPACAGNSTLGKTSGSL